jgi:hypothetical protein
MTPKTGCCEGVKLLAKLPSRASMEKKTTNGVDDNERTVITTTYFSTSISSKQ